MTDTPPFPQPRLTRRTALAFLAATAAGGPALAQSRPVVTILGDSITAGYGLPAASALPAQLQAELSRRGAPAVVRGAGVSGDTTGGGLARLDFSVQRDTRVCVVALGGNDLLRGLDPKVTRANLDKIVTRLKSRGIGVVLAGVRAPSVAGRSYAQDFNAIFPEIAGARGAVLVANMLQGVTGVRGLNQGDGIHPNAQGARLVAQNLAPGVARALAARR